FSDGNFFQIIEGEKEIISKLFEAIKEDKRHHNIMQIFGKDIHKEAYDGYDSDFVSEQADYDPEKFQHYLNQIKVLEISAQAAVKNILKAFLPI
ncbi:BLUF domain-containing protein, partial [Gillisia marina]|uniref:BLUF domain-containing protein n=1 Tax=Gillisia marina TaxID=1167637 RepID=UPI00029A6D8C